MLGEVERGGVGDFKARKRPSCQGIKVERDLLRQVDDLIAELYGLGEQTLWRLNCLVYAGAVMVERRARRSQTRSKDGVRKDKAIRDKETDVISLRRKIGWLTDEISRRRSSRCPTARQRCNQARLRKMFGAQNLQQLKVQLEQEKARLRVRSLQLRRLRSNQRQRAINDRYRRQGPGALGDGQTSSKVSSIPTADQITEYWMGVVGVPGTSNLDDPAIVQWQAEMGGLPDSHWEEPALAVWKCALRKIKSWKAPELSGGNPSTKQLTFCGESQREL